MSQTEITPIIVEKEGVSDSIYKIVELYCDNGDKVEQGDLILCFETSKTAIDIEAPKAGYVFYNSKENQSIGIGETIAIISTSPTFSKNYFDTINEEKIVAKKSNKSIRISKSAQKLIESNDLDTKLFEEFELLTEKDVKAYLAKNNTVKLSTIKFSENDLVIYGGGGHAKMCVELINQSNTFKVKGIIDDNIPIGTAIFEVPVLGSEFHLDQFIKQGLTKITLGIGAVLNHDLRNKLFAKLKSKKLDIPTIIHPSAMVEPSVKLGEGNQIMQGAIIGSNVQIGDNCIINSGCIISHDAIIGNHVHIAPGAIIAGGVTIGDHTIVGMGVTVFLGLNIGANVIVYNGVHVFNNVADNEVLRGSI